jgi:hypothetical protein
MASAPCRGDNGVPRCDDGNFTPNVIGICFAALTAIALLARLAARCFYPPEDFIPASSNAPPGFYSCSMHRSHSIRRLPGPSIRRADRAKGCKLLPSLPLVPVVPDVFRVSILHRLIVIAARQHRATQEWFNQIVAIYSSIMMARDLRVVFGANSLRYWTSEKGYTDGDRPETFVRNNALRLHWSCRVPVALSYVPESISHMFDFDFRLGTPFCSSAVTMSRLFQVLRLCALCFMLLGGSSGAGVSLVAAQTTLRLTNASVTSFAGQFWVSSPFTDGVGTAATFDAPLSIALNSADTLALVVRHLFLVPPSQVLMPCT